jgi:hypothetical protein
MQKHVSKTSLTDSTTSSQFKKAKHTHVIIQNHSSDNGGMLNYLVLPVEQLVNFGRPLKANDMATYKLDMKSRGTNRGRIVLLGNHFFYRLILKTEEERFSKLENIFV